MIFFKFHLGNFFKDKILSFFNEITNGSHNVAKLSIKEWSLTLFTAVVWSLNFIYFLKMKN